MGAAAGVATITRPAGRTLPPWILDFNEASKLLRIRDKRSRLVPLVPNVEQRLYLERRARRTIVLKARQIGMSTIIDALGYHQTITTPGTRGVIVAPVRPATHRLKARVDLMHREMPVRPRAEYDSRAELSFSGLDSTIYIGTAGGRNFGRADTVHWAHLSEVAFWPSQDVMIGLQEAVTADGWITIESTPNGFNFFYQLVRDAQAGLNPYRLVFLPWFLHPEYAQPGGPPQAEWTDDEKALAQKALAYGISLSPGQVAWRRDKAAGLRREGQDMFLQEYPEDVQSCFLTTGNPRFDNDRLNRYLAEARRPLREERVPESEMTIRIWAEPDARGYYVIGADSAEGIASGDYNAACALDWRTGHKVASLHGRSSLFRYAEALKLLGNRYNVATLAVERRHPGPAVLAKLVELAYPNLFYHQDDHGKRADQPGFDTNTYWRPLIIDALDEAVQAGSAAAFPDEAEIGEMMSFVVKGSKSEAADGAHDDQVMARAIATKVRELVRPRESGQPQRARSPIGSQW